MFSKVPSTGHFNGLSLHEMFLQLIEGRFSGSIEIQSDDTIRTFHFDKGLLCAASSNAPDEQLDGMLEREKSQNLYAEQLIEIEERRKKGQSFGKALVDSGFIPATELLDYSKKMAEIIFKKALTGIARSYRLDQGKSPKYHPLPFDPLVALFQSIVTDVDPEQVREKLGDEETRYTRTVTYFSAVSALRDNEEIMRVIDHLDGKRTVKEITDDLEINPGRTAGILLFLKWMDWIEPATADSVANFDESPLIIARAGANFAADTSDQDLPPDPVKSLKLVEKEDEIISDFVDSSIVEESTSAPGPEKITSVQFDRTLIDQIGSASAPEPAIQSVSTNQTGKPSGFMHKKSRGKFVFRILVPALGSLVIVFIAAMAMLSSASGSKKTAQPTIIDAKTSATTEKQQSPPDTTRIEAGNSNDVEASNQIIKPVIDENNDITSNDVSTLAWSKTQPLALRNCAAGNWGEALRIWKQQMKTRSGAVYTVLLISVNKDVYLESVFERFANSASLRREFFILDRKQKSTQLYFACWGIFPDLTSARTAVDTLPDSISRLYTPDVKSLAELTR